MTFLVIATAIMMVSTVLVTFLTRNLAKDVMDKANTAVNMTKEASVWEPKAMTIVPNTDGTFTMEAK